MGDSKRLCGRGLNMGRAGQVVSTDGDDFKWVDSGGESSAVSIPPIHPGSLDDEFSDATLDLTRWTWMNQGPATAILKYGIMSLRAPANLGDSFRIITQPVPSGAWQVTARILLTRYATDYGQGGIVVSDGTKCQVWGPGYVTAWVLIYSKFLNPTTWNANVYNIQQPGAGGIICGRWFYLRWTDDGTTNVTMSHSFDGINFMDLYAEARTAFLTPTLVGLFANSNDAAHDTVMAVDWFRRTA